MDRFAGIRGFVSRVCFLVGLALEEGPAVILRWPIVLLALATLYFNSLIIVHSLRQYQLEVTPDGVRYISRGVFGTKESLGGRNVIKGARLYEGKIETGFGWIRRYVLELTLECDGMPNACVLQAWPKRRLAEAEAEGRRCAKILGVPFETELTKASQVGLWRSGSSFSAVP
jgi:hypothetical protein